MLTKIEILNFDEPELNIKFFFKSQNKKKNHKWLLSILPLYTHNTYTQTHIYNYIYIYII